ncbi:hypothetical protein ACKI2N_018745 [Cupriavidus sp. 30B13]|uniref:hypothetical protein n=1 Tax=Cupriavidus sp. 30B13 TaxID=3384241 RepID=UPI003B906CD7
MNAKRILGSALGALILASSAAALAAPAGSKVGKFDVYADALSKADVYTDGAKKDKFDPFTDGLRQGKFDSFSEGRHAAFTGEVAASSLDNSRSGDGSLYGYRV